MSDFNLEEASINSIHTAMKNKSLSCRILTEAYLSRIADYDKAGPELHSIISLNPRALDEAEKLDRVAETAGEMVGPLHGIPVLLKDSIATRDLPTSLGLSLFQEKLAGFEATVAEKLRAAGALIIGKTNLHELALSGETISSAGGQTLNPYDFSRTPGGSSGGSAAAVAANLAAVSIGTDTVNSVRSPASACSLVGMKPTRGLISRSGICISSFTQDSPGTLTRNVTDCAILLGILCGYDPADAATGASVGNTLSSYRQFLIPTGLQGTRIGILRSFFGTSAEHSEVNQIIGKAVESIQEQGAVVVEIKDPIDSDTLVARNTVNLYETRREIDSHLKLWGNNAPCKTLEQLVRSNTLHHSIREIADRALSFSLDSDDYSLRMLQRHRLQEYLLTIMADSQLDALMFPHQRVLVCKVGESQRQRNGVLGAVTGFPALVVPAGFSAPADTAPSGVPVGLELLGRPWSEGILLKIAYAFELSYPQRKPPVTTPKIKNR